VISRHYRVNYRLFSAVLISPFCMLPLAHRIMCRRLAKLWMGQRTSLAVQYYSHFYIILDAPFLIPRSSVFTSAPFNLLRGIYNPGVK
jgi:hypothetical protein